MIDFACKQFDLDEIIKCGLSLTKAEYIVMLYFLNNSDQEIITNSLAKAVSLNLTTIQKAVKKLSDKDIISKHQKNLDNGGYVFVYICNPKTDIRNILKKIIRNWSDKVEQRINIW